MPPPLPERYHLEVRIGRDGDTEQWLATDQALDRPVLLRILGPDTTPRRRDEFLTAVYRAAGVSHVHMAAIYEASAVPDGAYAVCEWGGGVTLSDRIASGETIPIHDFLANAAGLADALAALHREGVLHGVIDPSAVLYSSAHPAKLAAFGRPHSSGSAATDVRDLAATLELALVGPGTSDVAPSQVVNGLPATVDSALSQAKTGILDAAGLAQSLRSIPATAPPAVRSTSSWAWAIPAAILAIVALSLIVLGSSLETGTASPLMFPARPQPATSVAQATPAAVTTTAPQRHQETPAVVIGDLAAYDPFGDGSEQHSRDYGIDNLVDGDETTTWRTERYNDPLSQQKAGVGVAIGVTGRPSYFEAVLLSPGVHHTLYWAEQIPEDFGVWERIATGISEGGNLTVQLPARVGGGWLLWFTDVPGHEDGYYAELGDVRFLP